MRNKMFGDKKKKLTDSERSLISETVSIEGTINSSGAIDVAGLIKGPVYSKEIIVRENGVFKSKQVSGDVSISNNGLRLVVGGPGFNGSTLKITPSVKQKWN